MNEIQIVSIADIEPYRGEHAIPGIRFRAARDALGISAWGMNVIELDPRCEGYPEHDHAADGQEEVYVILDGAVTLQVDGVDHAVGRMDMVRVPPGTRRKFVTGESGATILALGGTPGAAYVVGSFA